MKYSILHIVLLLSSIGVNATNYTAISSGNFSSTSTWQGGVVPPVNVGGDDIFINSGVTVNLDQNIILNNGGSWVEIKPNGKIISTTNNYIALQDGTFTNSGEIDIDSMFVAWSPYFSLGTITVNRLELSDATIQTGDTINVETDLIFSGNGINGPISITGRLYYGTSTSSLQGSIIFNGGNPSVRTGLIVALPHSVIYKDNNRTIANTNWELNDTNLSNVTVDIGLAKNTSLQSDLDISFNLTLQSGGLKLNGNNITISKRGKVSSLYGYIESTNSSDIIITSDATDIGRLVFSNGSKVATFDMNSTNSNSKIKLVTPIEINSQLKLQKGIIICDSGAITLVRASIVGGSKDSYVVPLNNNPLTLDSINLSGQVYPVGTINGYAPVKITPKNNTYFGFLGVYTSDKVLSMGYWSGDNWAATRPVVAAMWGIKHNSSTTIDYDLDLSWDSSLEVNGFDNSNYFITNYDNNNSIWVNNSQTAAATTSGSMHTGVRKDLKNLGVFAVFDNKTLNIDDIDGNNAVNIYPNPTNSVLFFNLNNNKALQATIYDIAGRTVRAFEVNTADNSIDVSKLKPGMYYLQLTGDKVHAQTKFIKQ